MKIAFPFAIALVFALVIATFTAAPMTAAGQGFCRQTQTGPGCCAAMQAPVPDVMTMAEVRKANTARLNALLTQMNSATGETKVDAMAAAVAILLEERAAMLGYCAACPMSSK
jgi:hypothetical protein